MHKYKEKIRPFTIIFLTGYLAYTSIYIARLNMSIAAALYEAAGILNKAQIGAVSSIFAFTYAVCKIPNGFLGDRLSPKKVIVFGLAVTGASNLLVGFRSEFISISVFWGLNAFGQSMLWGPMLRVLSEFSPEDQFNRYSQALVSSVGVGGIAGLLLATYVGAHVSAAACFYIPGLIALSAAVLVVWLFPNQYSPAKNKDAGILRTTGNLLRDSRFRGMIVPAVAHGMIKDNINVWLALYCVDTFGINLNSLAGYIFFVPGFAFIGRLLYPLASKLSKNDYLISAVCFGLCVAAAVPLCAGASTVFVSMACLGAVSALTSMINTHILSIFPGEFLETGNISFVASILDFLAYGGFGIGSLLFGMMIQTLGYRAMFETWQIVSCVSIFFLVRALGSGKERVLNRKGPEAEPGGLGGED